MSNEVNLYGNSPFSNINGREGTNATAILDLVLSTAGPEVMELFLNAVGYDEQINDIKQAMRARNKQKKALNEKIRRLRDALANSSAKDPDDLVYIHGGLENPKDQAESKYAGNKEEQHRQEKDFKDNWTGTSFFQFTHLSEEQIHEKGFFRKKEVEAKLENLKTQLDDLNIGSQMEMLTLQQLYNYRSQAINAASNLQNRSHGTNMSVIQNIK